MLIFELDESIERGTRVIALLDELNELEGEHQL
jgi:hypothetical protein